MKTECLRNFTSGKFIVMPETIKFSDIVNDVKKQFASINADLCQETMSKMENLMKIGNYVPLFIKKPLIRKVGEAERGYSALLSNLGVIKLPKEIEDKVEMLSFPIGNEPHVPYQFSCATVGNALTVTIVATAKDNRILDNIYSALTASEGEGNQ